jgi:hypothetical protein
VEDLATGSSDVSAALRPDGAGGLAFSDVAHADATGQTEDDHHPRSHTADHESGGAQEISVADLSGKLADVQYPDNVAIYEEGGAAGGNRHTSFDAARAQLAAVGGGTLIVDGSSGSPVVPAGGPYDVTRIKLDAVGGGATLTVQDGATFTTSSTHIEIGQLLNVVSDATAAPFAFSTGVHVQIVGLSSAIVSNSGKESLFSFSGNAIPVFVLRDGARIKNTGGSEPVENNSSVPVSLSIGAAACKVDSNTFKGSGNVVSKHDEPSAVISTTHTNLSGTFTVDPDGDGDAGVGHDHTGETHTGSSGNVKGAISSLDSAVEIGADAMHLVTAGEVAAGYFALPSTPKRAASVKIWVAEGTMQVNKQIVGATGASPDFDVGVDGAADRVSINNNGAATGLSGDIIAADVLIVSYEV